MQNGSSLLEGCLHYPEGEKIVSLPLEFAYLPVDILSKQFTKLNSPHDHRIHYLGPRFTTTQALHKKMAYSEASPYTEAVPNRLITKYNCIDSKRVVNSFFINQKLKNNHFYKTGVYYRAFEGMNPSLDLTNQITFSGSFQSANLDCVIKFKPHEYDLFLRVDSNTRGHLQWFYFSLCNGKQLSRIKLNICNIQKPGSLYQSCMPPYYFSQRAFSEKGRDWEQGSPNITNISFQQKQFNYAGVLEDKCRKVPYCYSFEYEFEFEDDQVYFAYCIPYTYSELIYDIQSLPEEWVTIHKFARSFTGVDIPLLHITDRNFHQNKKSVLVTGRIHPGESNSSHVLKGFLEYLCSNEKGACDLRRRTNFYIIPMINPDGVILGNHRTGASGKDLNRMFMQTDRELFPEIYHFKLFSAQMMAKNPFLVSYDFHGHSKKKNTFFYGPAYLLSDPNYYKCRVLARIIQKSNNAFRYWSCLFAISESKKTTGRAFLFETLQIPFAYTVQSSIGFYYDSQKLKTFPFSSQAWKQVGASICQGTSSFILAYEEYENFLMERRAIRDRKKIQKISFTRRSMNRALSYSTQQNSHEQIKSGLPLKIAYKDRQQCLFLRILEEIKSTPEQIPSEKQILKGMDEEASSDDHDEAEDLELTKLKQFNNLIIQSGKKNRNPIKSVEQEERKGFVRSNTTTNRSKLEFSSSEKMKNLADEEELSLFEQMRKKPSSSQGFRKKMPAQRATLMENRTKARSIFSRNQINLNQNDRSGSIEEQELEANANVDFWQTTQNFQLRSVKNSHQSMGQHSNMIINSARIKTPCRWRGRVDPKVESSHFSQMQFPDHEVYQNKTTLKHSKNDLVRKNIQRKKQRLERKKNRFSLEKTSFEQEKPVDQAKKIVEFKIEDLMTNLEQRSQIIRDSVKYKEDKRKVKVKSNSLFPSSFYGVKEQHKSRKPASSRGQEQNGLSITAFSGKREANNF